MTTTGSALLSGALMGFAGHALDVMAQHPWVDALKHGYTTNASMAFFLAARRPVLIAQSGILLHLSGAAGLSPRMQATCAGLRDGHALESARHLEILAEIGPPPADADASAALDDYSLWLLRDDGDASDLLRVTRALIAETVTLRVFGPVASWYPAAGPFAGLAADWGHPTRRTLVAALAEEYNHMATPSPRVLGAVQPVAKAGVRYELDALGLYAGHL
jgi:hypothetical protein